MIMEYSNPGRRSCRIETDCPALDSSAPNPRGPSRARQQRLLTLWSTTMMPAARRKRDAARTELREQIVAREQVEHSLEEARVMFPMLETQLECIAQGEPFSRTDDQRHELERQWEEVRLDRQQAEQEREGSCQPSGGRGTAVRGPWPLRWLRRLLERQEPPRRDPVRGNAVPLISLERPHGSQ